MHLALLIGLVVGCGGAGDASGARPAAELATAARQSSPTTTAPRSGATAPAAPTPLGPIGRWTIEPLSPPRGGPFDYPVIAMHDGRIAIALTTLGGGPAFVARHDASGWQYDTLPIENLASLRLAFDAQGALSVSARRITISPTISTEVLVGQTNADGLTFEMRATPCDVVPGSHSILVGRGRTIHSYACGASTLVAERSASGWTTLATLEGLDLTDMALAPDGVIHAAAHVLRSQRSEHVIVRGRTVERLPLAETNRAHVEIARDGAVQFVYDRLAPGLSGEHQIVLVTHRGTAASEETIGEGMASAFALDASDRPVVLSASMLGLTTARVHVRGANGWTSLPFAEDQGDTVIHGAVVDTHRRLHVVYAWTGRSGRMVRYAVVRLPG